MAPEPSLLLPDLDAGLQQAYVSELLSYPLDRLHKEPELLRVDAERISRQMQEVAVGNYRAFITAAESLQSISKEVTTIDKHLENLVTEIPNLTTGCNEFMDQAQQILEKRKMNRTLLANHSTLLDLLEIPQLMDTCVRNGNYDEALDLETFVVKLATMHVRLPVIQSLLADVKHTTQSLISQLLQRLRSNIQLPECLRIIGYLRRLGVFNDQEMRLQFLRCREAWLGGMLEELDQGSPYEHLKRMSDCHRVYLFDIVTQYRAIFADDDDNDDGAATDASDAGALLYSWAMHRITCHLNLLQLLLPKITEGASLAIILDQCMYCGMSLGRVGLDFRGMLPPLFESSVHDLFVRNMAIATENFEHMLKSHIWVPLPPSRVKSCGVNDEVCDEYAPPSSLMDHMPLAVFVNGILAALNELRHCSPLNLKTKLSQQLHKALKFTADALLRYNSTRVFKDAEFILFTSMCRAFVEVACPYCIGCFRRCYPGDNDVIDAKEICSSLRKLIFSSSSSSPIFDKSSSTSLRNVPSVVQGIITNLPDGDTCPQST